MAESKPKKSKRSEEDQQLIDNLEEENKEHRAALSQRDYDRELLSNECDRLKRAVIALVDYDE